MSGLKTPEVHALHDSPDDGCRARTTYGTAIRHVGDMPALRNVGGDAPVIIRRLRDTGRQRHLPAFEHRGQRAETGLQKAAKP